MAGAQFGRSWADILFHDIQLFMFNAAPKLMLVSAPAGFGKTMLPA